MFKIYWCFTFFGVINVCAFVCLVSFSHFYFHFPFLAACCKWFFFFRLLFCCRLTSMTSTFLPDFIINVFHLLFFFFANFLSIFILVKLFLIQEYCSFCLNSYWRMAQRIFSSSYFLPAKMVQCFVWGIIKFSVNFGFYGLYNLRFFWLLCGHKYV